MDITAVCNNLRKNSKILAGQTAKQKNAALASVCKAIEKHRKEILKANEKDINKAALAGMSEALIERLSLDDKKIDGIIGGIRTVIAQSDPIGEEISGWKMPNGIYIRQIRVPIGVAAIIYESRPNVTADAFCLAYKSGNAILLRGSSSALFSNKEIIRAIKEGLSSCPDGVSGAVELADCSDRSDVDRILSAVGLIDVVLPRGGEGLIKTVVEKAKIPVIQTGSGVCHIYVDKTADHVIAARIAENSKIQRPGACNAVETVLVHKDEADEFLPLLERQLAGRVQLRADGKAFEILHSEAKKNGRDCVIKADDKDFGFEFLDLVCAVKTVNSLEEAVSFINEHGTKHSDCIITNDLANARKFQQQIDSACVYVNASTRFTDGGEFGFGMELGISTQKLHARGPMGIRALTTTKFLIDGEGQIR
ncbi:glutamate-5-semialdehyde dehydrogenase [Treponema parvum]|uniref:glutamate-5-semialdehyde dehydrogenase n=1 Tax=Treponema parvum TaxID=138851 RepID=UPI001AEC5A8F|nr:glutamate-5-semialdehyde dehydrogenase [Treponema parvum]QTQ15353.1 glutamate-5-semialdehyde dehydrogenase [Treponema parvum]